MRTNFTAGVACCGLVIELYELLRAIPKRKLQTGFTVRVFLPPDSYIALKS
jgi:hypothetical protein